MIIFQLKQKTGIMNRVDYVEIKGEIKFKVWLKVNLKMRFVIAY